MTRTNPVLSRELTKEIFKLEKKVSEELELIRRYKKEYVIRLYYMQSVANLLDKQQQLIKQWNCLPDNVKETTHKELQKENL